MTTSEQSSTQMAEFQAKIVCDLPSHLWQDLHLIDTFCHLSVMRRTTVVLKGIALTHNKIQSLPEGVYKLENLIILLLRWGTEIQRG